MAGQIGRGGWSVPLSFRHPQPRRASLISDNQEQFDPVGLIVEALEEDGRGGVSFVVEASSAPVTSGCTSSAPALPRSRASPPHTPGSLLLADGALPEPVRRLPDPTPDAVPAASADAALLRRTLRERLPDATGATEEEITAAEARRGPRLRTLTATPARSPIPVRQPGSSTSTPGAAAR
ncbi:hypothetical protein [Streptomyces sp. AC04842]|uniref:hypothetical protein n=1 Tax=Streptomyces sp. AC04842 TaxID=2775327 RepID=UPI0020C63E2F